jgi:hypothetical protein
VTAAFVDGQPAAFSQRDALQAVRRAKALVAGLSLFLIGSLR